MDDQNQTNQPLGQGMNPSNPNIPEDITPKDTPLSPITPEQSSPMMAPAEPVTASEPSDLYTTSQPTAPISTAPIEPVHMPAPAAETPFSPPTDTSTVTTEMPEIPAPTPMTGEQPAQTAPAEPTLPEAKPKKKILPVIGGVVALLLVAGVAGAAYYVSNQLSTRQAVAPTAPESKPAASTCSPINGVVNQGCAALGCPAGTRRECTCTATGYECLCINDSSCGGGTGGGGGSACGGSGQPACGVDSTGGEANNCPTSPYTYGCGMQCCNTDVNAVCCCTGCFPAGTDCSQHTCEPAPACGDASHPIDTIEQKEIKFEKTGKVIAFMRNAGYSGTITLKKGGVVAVTIPFTPTSAKELKSFNVNANDIYTISVKINNDPTDSYGWITNKTDNACGPIKTPGATLDGNSKPTGKCGLDVDITDIRNTALAKTTLDSIKVNGTTTSAAIECWADALQSDATQDYDFNDFTLIFGYEKVVVDDCAPKYFCNTNSYTCQATTGTYHDPLSPASDFVSCENANTCSQNLAADAANPDTGKCYATQAACQADCVSQAVGACTEIRVYKKEGTGYGLNALTSAQLNELKIGDVLKFVMKTNTNNLQGKFRVSVDNAVDMDWTWGDAVHEVTWSEIKYEGYTVNKAGSYKFEGQVTTTP